MKVVGVILIFLISTCLWSYQLDARSYYSSCHSDISNIELKGTITKESVELSFSAKLKNIRYYIIERSQSDKLDFIKIGHLLPSKGQSELYHTDDDVIEGLDYHYRVISVTNKGEEFYSSILTINVGHSMTQKKTIHKYIYQEDSNIVMRLISSHESHIEGAFYNINGELIYNLNKKRVTNGLNEFLFDISSFTSDDYLLIMKVGKENIIERITVNPH
jgi:hypothetical protein